MTEETQPVEEPTEAPEVPGVYVVGENGPEELVVPLDSAPLEVSRLTSWTVSPDLAKAFAMAAGLGQSDETTKE